MTFHPDFNPPQFAEFPSSPVHLLSFADAVLALQPAAFYRFSEPQGSTTAQDQVAPNPPATHHPNTLTGSPGSLPLDPDPALTFAQTNAYTRAAYTPSDTQDFTLLLRAKRSPQTPGGSILRPLIAGYGNQKIGLSHPGLHLSVQRANTNQQSIRYQLGHNQETTLSTGFNNGQWHTFALRRQTNTRSLFINGELAHQGSAGTLNLSHPFELGGAPRDSSGGSRYFRGQLDEFAAFDLALTAEQLRELHQLASGH